MSTFANLIQEFYLPQLQAQLKRDLARQLFWDGTYGPPDTRPVYGPFDWSDPGNGACGLMGCKCCEAYERDWDNHCC